MSTPRFTDTAIFTAALGVAVVHALDDAFLGRQPGVPLDQHAVAGLGSVVVAAGALAVFRRSRPGVRAALAMLLGVPALVNGAMHVVHVSWQGPDHSDVTGLLAALAGAVLIALGASIPWRHRSELATSTRRRWVARAVAVPAFVVTAFAVAMPLAFGVSEVHKPRGDVGSPPNGAYRDVTFSSADGLELSGWYRPSRNGATMLVIHGGGGDRTGAVRHARMLESHGYGVLLYDARGRGRSEGTPNSYGWDWEKDAAGAMDFLASRPVAERGRVGALGLSSGGDTVIDLAAHDDRVEAAVTDGAALRTFEDAQRLKSGVVESVPGRVMFGLIRAFSGQKPSAPLEDLVAEVDAPMLLISAGESQERDFNVKYARVMNDRSEHWNLPDAGHTGGLRHQPEAYEQHVMAFLDRTLTSDRAAPVQGPTPMSVKAIAAKVQP